MASKLERRREIGRARERERDSPALIRGVTTLLLLCVISGISGDPYCHQLEQKHKSETLIKKINSKRIEAGVGTLTADQTLCYVAMKHVLDLTANANCPKRVDGSCNTHSWGNCNRYHLIDDVKSCCYPRDGGDCIWLKPTEFNKGFNTSTWDNSGYEIVSGPLPGMTPEIAVQSWLDSTGVHKEVMLKKYIYKDPNETPNKPSQTVLQKRIGAAVWGKFAVAWFSG